MDADPVRRRNPPERGRVRRHRGAHGSALPCEFTGDAPAAVDIFDLLRYLDAWFGAAPAADLDGGGAVDVTDLLAYLDCWFGASAGAACP